MILTLPVLWLNDASDTTDRMSFEINDIKHSPTANVRIDQYAANNFRAIEIGGPGMSADVTLSFCTDDQVTWLRSKIGTVLCYRDPRGEKFYGLYVAPGFAPRTMPNSWAVTLTVAEVTVDEAVA